MPAYLDLTNQRFGQLVAVERAGSNKHHQSMWRCLCDCGRETLTMVGNLTAGASTSCGHDREANMRQAKRRHGKRWTREYYIWNNMKQRCRNPRDKDYKYYGGRGIKVCERWKDFNNFLADMGECPSGFSIERIDVDGHYEPVNCKWIPLGDQRKNQRRSRK